MSEILDFQSGVKTKTPNRSPMRYKSVTITKVENNGYLVSCHSFNLGAAPKQEDFVFTDFEQVVMFLKPDTLKLAH